MNNIENQLIELSKRFLGELHFDSMHKTIYATDASVYRKLPLAVAFPKDTNDIKLIIDFAKANQVSLIPRTAGTSLAGQCVGEGIVVDVSKYFTEIISLNTEKRTVTVQPGVIRDELNRFLKPHGLFFGPNTSTSNRCMIGGMVGNNSSGSTSIQYGVTRDKVQEMQVLLSDGSKAVFHELSKEEFEAKLELTSLEGELYKTLNNFLSNEKTKEQIKENFPKPGIHRRNTGYAVDMLLDNLVFGNSKLPFNMCKLLAGSEGTLAFTTQVTLSLDELPPAESVERKRVG